MTLKMSAALPRIIALLILAAVPLVQHNAYWLHVFSLALIAAILALGMQLLLGMAGLLSLGQGAFYGIGAYVAGGLAANYGVPFFLTLLAGGLAAAAASLLLIPLVRLKGTSLAVATLGFSIIVHLVILNEEWLTGGSMGLMDIPNPTVFGLSLAGDNTFYWICLAILTLVFIAMDRIRKSRFGRALSALAQDEEAARASGIRLAWAKSKCFLVAAFTAGVAGGLFAYHSRYLSPSDFTFNESIEIMIMAVIGGLGSLSGAVVGAFVVVLMPEVLRSSGELRMILFGLAVILLMAAGNLGIVGLVTLGASKVGGLFTSLRARRAAKPREAN